MNNEQERSEFKKHYGTLFDLSETTDSWGNPRFVHEHVESIWYGWNARAALQSQEWEDIKEVIERLPRYSFGNISDEWGAGQYLGAVRHDNGRFLRVDEVMVAIYNARRHIEEEKK